ncbi:MAG TPA: hypothetical protein VNV66_02515 [Pilimelia sp.]|nr:hypothetical protein [Pilimelia sp.]
MARTPALSRRTVLAAAGGAVAAGLPAGPARATATAAGGGPATRAATPRPVSMALHIHGPFSEGTASYEAHLHQARRHRVDVIWWTDHDFRVAAHDHRQAVRFDGPVELEGELEWTWVSSVEGTPAATAAEFVDEPRSADEPGRALRLSVTGGAYGGALWYAGAAWNLTHRACIADTSLFLDVLPEQAGPAAVLLLELELSYHPARAGRPAGSYMLRYRVGGTDKVRHTAAGLVGTVDVPARAGRWTRLALDLVADVTRLWPDLVAQDNSLVRLRLGAGAGSGAAAGFVVDRLRFHRARRQGQAGEQLRAEVLERYGAEYPDVTHYPAYEISLVRHLNWFGGDQTLPPFPSPPRRDNDPRLAASMVEYLRRHGGVVCWNHPLDVERRETLAALMVKRNALGVDVVEFGREPYPDLLWVLDVAARNALFVTAVGTSDDHDGKDWFGHEENRLTYVWAPSTDKADLVAALRRGSAWFVDPARYRGALDIRVGAASAMGAVAVAGVTAVPVELLATDLPRGATLEIVSGLADRAGTRRLAPSATVTAVPATELRRGRYRFRWTPAAAGGYLRLQVRTKDRAVVAVGNPLWVLRKKPPYPVPAERRLTLPG